MISEFIAAWKELSRMSVTNNNKRIKSLADASNKLIARFPVVCSSGISSKTMYLVTTALEMKYAAELKVVMQNMFTVDNVFANSASDYLDRFHTNDDTEETVHSYPRNSNLYETAIVKPDYYMQRLDEQFGVPLCEASGPHAMGGGNKKYKNKSNNTNSNNNSSTTPPDRVAYQSREFETKLMPTDVQKANSMQPTVISIKITTVNRDKDGGSVGTFNKNFEIGVKTRCVAVTSEEMVDNITKAVKRNMTAFNFIKAITGEISFLKDFVFMADEIKDDYKDKGYNTIWNRLRNRSMISKIQNFLKSSNGIIPNTTFILSKEEVERLELASSILVDHSKDSKEQLNEDYLNTLARVSEADRLAASHIKEENENTPVNAAKNLTSETITLSPEKLSALKASFKKAAIEVQKTHDTKNQEITEENSDNIDTTEDTTKDEEQEKEEKSPPSATPSTNAIDPNTYLNMEIKIDTPLNKEQYFKYLDKLEKLPQISPEILQTLKNKLKNTQLQALERQKASLAIKQQQIDTLKRRQEDAKRIQQEKMIEISKGKKSTT